MKKNRTTFNILYFIGILIMLLISLIINTQAQSDPKKANEFASPQPIQNNLFTVELLDMVSKGDYNKMRFKITNKTSEYLLFKMEEATFVFPFGTMKPKPGTLIVPPMGTASKTLGIYNYPSVHTPNFKLEINGIYTLPKDVIFETPAFVLPVVNNQFTAGPFTCQVDGRVKKETDETVIGFKCTFLPTDNSYGVVSANKISVFTPKNSREYATILANKKPEFLEPGEKFNLKAEFRIEGRELDMQFAEMQMLWKEVFTTLKPIPLGPIATVDINLTNSTIASAKSDLQAVKPTEVAKDRSISKEEKPVKKETPNPKLDGKDVKTIKNPAKVDPNDVGFDPKDLMKGGKYYALIIAVQDYKDPKIKKLSQPIPDAENLKNTLISQYTFESQNVVFLKNPSRSEIFKALSDLKAKLTGNDNLLIYYAGHGYYDKDNKTGYWLPADAERDNDANWFPNTDLTNKIAALKSRHILLIADACFSGGIFATRAAFHDASKAINEYYNKPSRRAITSGALTEVPDKSVFVDYLIKYLKNNPNKYMNSEKLYIDIKDPVINNSPVDGQEPLNGVIKQTGDEGGDFIFIKK